MLRKSITVLLGIAQAKFFNRLLRKAPVFKIGKPNTLTGTSPEKLVLEIL